MVINMKIKKSIAIILATIIVVVSALCVQFSVLADSSVTDMFDAATATLTISGNGAMTDYDENNMTDIPWYDYRDEIEHVVIEDGVTHIGSYAFSRDNNLVSVEIADSVVSIGTAAFARDDKLTEIVVPNSVTEIGAYAFGFDDMMNLTSGFVAYCGYNSAAQRYCFESHVPFDTPFPATGRATAVIKGSNYQAVWSFVAPVDGTLTFWSESTGDTSGLLYDASTYSYNSSFSIMKTTALSYIKDGYGSNGLNFRLTYNVEAGKRYYMAAKYDSASKTSGSFDVCMTFACEAHEYEMIADTVTCTENGTRTYKCQNCGDEYSEDVDALQHIAREHPANENEVAATCTTAGSYDEVYYCARCEQEISRETKHTIPVPHNCVAVATVEPTCTDQGYTTYACTNCDLEYNGDFVDALDHIIGEFVTENEVDPTCSAEGSYDLVVYCQRCNEEIYRETKYVEPIEHTPGETQIENRVEATCSSAGHYDEVTRCIVCEQTISITPFQIDPIAHTPGEMVVENETAPTCTNVGYYDEVVRCIACGATVSEERKYVEAPGHDSSAVDFADGLVGIECAVCGDYYTVDFMSFLNQENALLDVVEDGIVNAKDYAKFRREYPVRDIVCDIDLTSGTVSKENAVLADGVLTLTPSGKYNTFNITGDSEGIQIVVNASKDTEIKLNNANISVDSKNAIVINNTSDSDVVPEVTISATEGTENSITVTTTGNAINNYSDNGACKVDLKGHGVLTINSASTAINSGAKVEIKNLTLNITTDNRGIDTKFTGADGIEDYANVSIKGNATITINSVDDGIRCKNFETTELVEGEVDSVLTIVASGDGVQMEGKKSVMNSGVINIEAGGYAFNCKAANFSTKPGATINADGAKGYSK